MKRFLYLLIALLAPLAARAARIDTLTIRSASMHKTLKATVAVPTAYAKSKQAWPVLYLLHGAGGHEKDWLIAPPTDKGLVARMADRYGLIIVMPDAGPISYYVDSPYDSANQYETHVTQEVRQAVEKRYRTRNTPQSRAIAGLSMGGHGAMLLASRHPELYGGAGSMSGALDLNTRHWARDSAFRMERRRTFERLMGPEKDTAAPFPAYSAVDQIERFKANRQTLIIDCGVDDFLIGPAREMHRRLLAAGIPHTYIERPGKHDWAYWEGALEVQVMVLRRGMKL